MENMSIYNAVRECPQEAQKTIQAGKLKGKTDINPMWRIKQLTELFGPCGMGWKTEEEKFWTTPGANGEVVAWCSLQLRWADKGSGMWSDPVFGIGGSMMVDTQRGSLSSNDEAYKMAYTDAISVACKALGFAADIYWEADRTKYDLPQPPVQVAPPITCSCCGGTIKPVKAGGKTYSPEEIAINSEKAYGKTMCWDCMKATRAVTAE